MTVRVRLFARTRDLVGADQVLINLAPGSSIGDLRRALAAMHPNLTSLLAHSALAVNDEFARDEQVLTPDQEVALLPPVSGG